jgi:hypothetical protein
MPTRAEGVSAKVQEVVEHGRALARLELELATFELRRKAAALGVGAALLGVAALCGLFALGFALAAVAAALSEALPTWLALLVVGGALLLAGVIAAVVGGSLLRRATPPVPEQALEEAMLTGDALRGNGRG